MCSACLASPFLHSSSFLSHLLLRARAACISFSVCNAVDRPARCCQHGLSPSHVASYVCHVLLHHMLSRHVSSFSFHTIRHSARLRSIFQASSSANSMEKQGFLITEAACLSSLPFLSRLPSSSFIPFIITMFSCLLLFQFSSLSGFHTHLTLFAPRKRGFEFFSFTKRLMSDFVIFSAASGFNKPLLQQRPSCDTHHVIILPRQVFASSFEVCV